ncbi:uncharacterized protein B0P05DRAFT_25688 [Gilbertella persicaria]|uniref:uncharacterized protein n=1 Tax=Gilbertella persicaria TaxID=101096 RepID=UPI0022207D9B|nr:uncharacterized protein B0P05DRAFT_25688 [Gilbertella persicaria]KAI8085868.1 hypothetical protein B0P05DRAFT_25688 [Gilbertella persicaria]
MTLLFWRSDIQTTVDIYIYIYFLFYDGTHFMSISFSLSLSLSLSLSFSLMSTTITKLFNDMSIDNNHESEHPINNKRKRAPFECTICMISYRSNISHSTNKCSHSICRECARKYFNSALEDVRYTSYETIECPSPDCKEHFVTQDVLQNLFSKAEMKRWWTFAIIKAHVKNKVKYRLYKQKLNNDALGPLSFCQLSCYL